MVGGLVYKAEFDSPPTHTHTKHLNPPCQGLRAGPCPSRASESPPQPGRGDGYDLAFPDSAQGGTKGGPGWRVGRMHPT